MRQKNQKLIDLINAKNIQQRGELSEQLSISFQYLQQIAYGFEKASAKLSRRIEEVTKGEVSAKSLRPDIFGDTSIEESYPTPAA